MKDLWWRIRGYLRLRLTGADPERTLRHMAGKIRMEDVCRAGPLEVEFSVSSSDLDTVHAIAERFGDRIEILEHGGFPQIVEKCLSYPVICLTVALMIFASLWLPGRVLFFRVEGNQTVPVRRILEEAAGCGLHFGAERGMVRSERVKNRLLDALPELSWIGVNTSGTVATITVQERQRSPEQIQRSPGNIVSAADGIVTAVTATAGTPLVKPGDGVRIGQTLISGYTDLGLCTHVEAADGEIFALTERSVKAVLPGETRQIAENGATVKKYSLLIGKNRINLYSDSGILHTGCGKMTQIRVLTLPGGWTLPLALMVETFTVSETYSAERDPEEAEAMLLDAARAELEQRMIAGEIRGADAALDQGEKIYRLTLHCRCHEMIGRHSSGILTEGDTNDGENDERGAG